MKRQAFGFRLRASDSERPLQSATSKAQSHEFRSRVLAVVRRIPRGRVATYGDVAALAGRPRAWRAVGNVMRHCGDPAVPCHRVVAAAGALGGYGGHLQLKRERLRAEGIEVGQTRIRRFSDIRWTKTTGRSR